MGSYTHHMDNNTPPLEPEESHDSFISQGNAAETSSVQHNMEDTTHPSPEDSSPASAGTVESSTIDATSAPFEEARIDSGSQHSEPLNSTANVDRIEDVAFVYDDTQSPASTPEADTGTFAAVSPPSAATAPSSVQGSYEHRNSGALYLIGALVAAILGSLLTVGMLALTGTFDDAPVTVSNPPATVIQTAQEPNTQIPNTQIINGLGSEVNETAIAAKVIPSIVTINVLQTSTDDAGNTGEVPTGSGSGVVQSTDGYIITNHHVIDGGDAYTVTFEDGREYEATLVGSDEYTDLAVLQISADGLVAIEYGSSEALAVGDPAVAVGNPLGQAGGSSITSGIISAFDRRVGFADDSNLFGMIQTDAAINSGSSGGALVDSEGRLIGITSAIGVSTAGPEGIGYAIPIELVDRITAEIIETGDVDHPFMGVKLSTFLDQAPDGAIVPAGAIIESIEEVEGFPSAAGVAGMQVDDIVVAIEGDPITSQNDLILEVRLFRVGDTITFTVDRDGEQIDLDVTLGKRPPQFRG